MRVLPQGRQAGRVVVSAAVREAEVSLSRGAARMTTLLYAHPACLGHDTGYGHPESADRLKALRARLEEPEFDGVERRPAPCAEQAQLARAHDIS